MNVNPYLILNGTCEAAFTSASNRAASLSDSDAGATCATVAATSQVSVLVMLCTAIGASPPISTVPTRICLETRRIIGFSAYILFGPG